MCVELDEALSHEPDEDEVLTRIGGVVWRHIFDKNDAISDEHVITFAK